MKQLRDFRLEVYFSKWEFKAKYHLTASDAQSLSISEVLAMGTDAEREEFSNLALGYIDTWGTHPLRQAIASTYASCDEDDVLCFAGAEEAMYVLLSELLGPDDHAIVTVPNYQSMEEIPLATGAAVTGVLLDPNNEWSFDLDEVRAAIQPNTKLIGVNFPNNPTGALPASSAFRELVELCDENGIRLFSDEVYRGIELDPARTLPQAADLSRTAVSLNVMSKAFGMPGLRVGWLCTRDHDLLARLERRKHYTSICNAGPSEMLATIALNNAERIRQRNRSIIEQNLPLFDAFFERHVDLFAWNHPQGGCVAFPRYLGDDGVEEFCRRAVEQEGVLLLPASVYESSLADVPTDRFRIGVGRTNPGPALVALERSLR